MSDYASSVIAAADDFGFLSPGDARRLVADHQLTWEAWLAEKPMAAGLCEVRPLLHWLGYWSALGGFGPHHPHNPKQLPC